MTTHTRRAHELTGWLDEGLGAVAPDGLEQLEEIVTDVGRSPWLWGHAVGFDLERRSHRVLYKTPHLEIALFGWAAGQDTTFHDHGGASGAAFVCRGELIEDSVEAVDGHIVRRETHSRRPETVFSFGPEYIHRVRHDARTRRRALDSRLHGRHLGLARLRNHAGRHTPSDRDRRAAGRRVESTRGCVS